MPRAGLLGVPAAGFRALRVERRVCLAQMEAHQRQIAPPAAENWTRAPICFAHVVAAVAEELHWALVGGP